MATKEKLTARQASVLEFIVAFLRKNGYSPSIHDIMEHFEIKSTHGVVHHLQILKRKGAIDYTPRIARSIRVTAT